MTITDKMWNESETGLYKEFLFSDFSEAWAFLSRVALLAEKMEHHPEWSNIYNRVSIRLITHDKGNTITEKDRLMADSIDKIFLQFTA